MIDKIQYYHIHSEAKIIHRLRTVLAYTLRTKLNDLHCCAHCSRQRCIHLRKKKRPRDKIKSEAGREWRQETLLTS